MIFNIFDVEINKITQFLLKSIFYKIKKIGYDTL